MSQELYDRERIYIAQVAKQIRKIAATTDFDHRKFISETWLTGKPIHGDEVEVSQGRLLYAIGKILQPKRVYEVGIGPGITAHSLFSAAGDIDYCGIDCAPTHFDPTFPILKAVQETVTNLHTRARFSGGTVNWFNQDSNGLDSFVHTSGPIDLIHIDGDHSYAHQRSDIIKGIQSGAEWLLVDDCNDTEVVTSCFEAWRLCWHNGVWRGGLLPFIYFEDSRTGSILFHSGMWRHV